MMSPSPRSADKFSIPSVAMQFTLFVVLAFAGTLFLSACDSGGGGGGSDEDTATDGGGGGGSGGGTTDDGTGSTDTTAPTVISVTPEKDATINGSTSIEIQFSESMTTASLIFTFLLGGFEAEKQAVWSTTDSTDDTLTISPVTIWNDGFASVLQFTVSDLAGNGSSTSLSYHVDAIVPSAATIDPTSGDPIASFTAIVIEFDEEMDPASLVLGGTLADESDGGVFALAGSNSDTVTVSPATAWSAGDDRTLTIDATDAPGNPAAWMWGEARSATTSSMAARDRKRSPLGTRAAAQQLKTIYSSGAAESTRWEFR
ncbi:MAG: Ig-like domain-containing protein [SAR324 cluster bacterium]|nr:Ig-like domain-containing protein [SAR324 cluster bacterium]